MNLTFLLTLMISLHVGCSEATDLLSLDAEGLLYFGERPADNNMCSAERRPTKLTPGVKKVN